MKPEAIEECDKNVIFYLGTHLMHQEKELILNITMYNLQRAIKLTNFFNLYTQYTADIYRLVFVNSIFIS